MKQYQSNLRFSRLLLYFVLALAVMAVIMFIRGDTWAHFVLIFPALLVLFVGIYTLDDQKTQRIQRLFQIGTLVKDLPYEREEYVNFRDLQAIVALLRNKDERQLYSVRASYTADSGSLVVFQSARGFPKEFLDAHPTVDLLVDPEDEGNYFLDFDLDPVRDESAPEVTTD